VTEQLAATDAGPLLEYLLCGAKTDLMRAHIGVHILRASLGVQENLRENVSYISLNQTIQWTDNMLGGHPTTLWQLWMIWTRRVQGPGQDRE
jgi:hypothetical protein